MEELGEPDEYSRSRTTNSRNQNTGVHYLSSSNRQFSNGLRMKRGTLNNRSLPFRSNISNQPISNFLNPDRSKIVNTRSEISFPSKKFSLEQTLKTNNPSLNPVTDEKYLFNEKLKSDLMTEKNDQTKKYFKDLNHMKKLICKSSEEILLFILDDRSQFLSLFEEHVERELMAYVLIALGKAISVHINQHVNILVNKITSSKNFLTSISKYLASFQKISSQQIHQDSLVSLTDFLIKYQAVLPSSASDSLIVLLPLLKKICQLHLSSSSSVYDTVSKSIVEIEERNESFFKMFSPSEARGLLKKEKLQLEEPPENFRSIPILPRAEDFLDSSAFIRPNVVNGSYQDTEHYLDVQFRLLREDYIKSLRDGLSEYKDLKSSGKALKNCKNVRVYENVYIVSDQFVSSGLIHIAQFSDENFSRIRWEYNKRFMTGSLLCISGDSFENMLFATVAERRIDKLKEGKLMLRFEELSDEVLSISPVRKFTVIETSAYFEAYRHNLKALRELDEKKLPMKRYIVEVKKEVLKPKYLDTNTTYDMRPLFLPLDEKYINTAKGNADYFFPSHIDSQLKSIPVLNESRWPTAQELNLDPYQYDALKAAITKEFAIIQGPPGTGKTYIGLRLVQLLLHNIDKWTLKDQSSTILVVCYTNHALDQFLEGLVLFTKKIVRIGGRGQNEALERYQLQILKEQMEHHREVPGRIYSSIKCKKAELERLREDLNNLNKRIEKPSKSILDQKELCKFMSNAHFRIFDSKKYTFRGNLIASWLGINPEGWNDIDFDISEEFIAREDLSFDIHGKKIFDINPRTKIKDVPDDWIKLTYKDCYQKTVAVNLTNILNLCNPFTPVLAANVRNVWETDISVRWKLYKYWVQCFIEKKNEEYIKIERKLLTEFPINDFQNLHALKLQRNLQLIDEAIKAAFTTILNERDLSDCILPKQYLSLMGGERKARFPNFDNKMHQWLQLKVKNWSVMKDRVAVTQTLTSVLLSFQKEQKEQTTEVFNEYDNDEYEDVEYIEAQRNFDSGEFADVSFEISLQKRNDNTCVSSSNNWQTQGGKKARKKYITKNLHDSANLSEKEAHNISNLWELPIKKRWELYKYWLNRYNESNDEAKFKLHRSFRDKFKELRELQSLNDVHIAKRAHVVGITTTGAAKYKHIIDSLNPAIVIVEEAAEILESHIVTSLASATRHVILIGDHQQLRPSPTVHMLAVKYDLNVSLFERMVKNGLECQRLGIQHRMRPEIAALLVPHIYKNLINHESVSKFENVRGVSSNVYFISHSFNERQETDSKSRVNQHEAKFLIELCRYFIQQNYEPSQITILTTYTGQLFELKKLSKGKFEDVRITVVDNYQGEENEIILISFVRSNEEGEIGFLKVSNRVCVALSRAKKGLYCIGNFKLLAEISALWTNITSILQQKNLIGISLELRCQNHPTTSTLVAKVEDFNTIPDGGCSLCCEYRLNCGHICPLNCHPYDREHENIQCKKPCTKFCVNGHLCKKQCYMECGFCFVEIPKILNTCKHEVLAECYLDEEKIICPKPCNILLTCEHTCKGSCGKCKQGQKHVDCDEKCEKILICGHNCDLLCSEECGSCQVSIIKKLETCGHEAKIKCCEKDEETICNTVCEKQLKCGHSIKAKCFMQAEKLKCSSPCEKLLPCGHRCLQLCGEKCTSKCEENCLMTSPYCGHKMSEICFRRNNPEYLTKKCFEPCNAKLLCQHTCTGTCNSCHQGRVHIACNEKCKRILICGHECESICSISCPPCKKACGNWCAHKKCMKKCNEFCEPCQEPCTWICSHKRCTRFCGDECDRSPCDEPCQKVLACKHPCIGFCGEPCPELCRICNSNNKAFFELYGLQCELYDKRYVLLEDCGHIFDVEILDDLMHKNMSENFLIKFEACPKCGTIIRKNYRFGNVIKACQADIEKAKEIMMKKDPVTVQKKIALSKTLIILNERFHNGKLAELFRCMLNVLKSTRIRSIQELEILWIFINLSSNLISSTVEGDSDSERIENDTSDSDTDTDFSNIEDIYLNSSFKKLKLYTVASSTWITSILHDNFLTASEQQLSELSWEVHRIKLARQILSISSKGSRNALNTKWINLINRVMTYSPFRKKELEKSISLFIFLTKVSFFESHLKKKSILSVSGFSQGKFFKCPNGHVYQSQKSIDFQVYENVCSKCTAK